MDHEQHAIPNNTRDPSNSEEFFCILLYFNILLVEFVATYLTSDFFFCIKGMFSGPPGKKLRVSGAA